MRSRQSGARGQAIFETAIMMPLFLLGLFGIMFAVRQSAVSERVQLGVRYGGLVTARENPYLSYSLYSVYTTVDSQSPVNLSNCPQADQAQTTASRAVFWQPLGTPTFTCKSAVSIIKTAQGASQPILMQGDWMNLSAMTPTGGYLSASGRTFGSRSVIATIAAENFFRSPDIGQILQCGPLGNAVKSSLEGADSANASNTPPTAMPYAIQASPIIAVPQSCPTFAPLQIVLNTTPAPVPVVPSAPPMPTPTPTPKKTTTPTPTKAPTFTPTPVPSASPAPPTVAPTAVPTTSAAPTPSPTATPSPTPSPSPTAAPTASPTPNPYQTLPPGSSS